MLLNVNKIILTYSGDMFTLWHWARGELDFFNILVILLLWYTDIEFIKEQYKY